MESIVEFALYTWVAVSIVAVLVQLVRIARYRRANAARPGADAASPSPGEPGGARPTPPSPIDLGQPTAAASRSTTPPSAPATSNAATFTTANSDAVAAEPVPASVTGGGRPPEPSAPGPAATAPRTSPAMPAAPPSTADQPNQPSPTSSPEVATSDAEALQAESPDAEAESVAPMAPAQGGSPTLADLLAGVRLPWNLLPTVDQSHQPSNDRVALLTDAGEPNDVGADVADELERLGFSIATRGEDTAIATRGEHSLGLQIIPDAADARVGDQARFPGASAGSVALDIWIES